MWLGWGETGPIRIESNRMGRTWAIAAFGFLSPWGLVAQPTPGKVLPKFMGHDITLVMPDHDTDGFPKGPASVCVEDAKNTRQCYRAPQEFGSDPKIAVVQVDKATSALLFSAESVGGSGFTIHFALLLPGTGRELENILGVSASNQSQYTFWSDPAISDAKIFLTADYVWGPDEGHYDEHRYFISAYVRKPSAYSDRRSYYLEDRYMTVRKYDLQAKMDILTSEKQEILTRLRRAMAASAR
jgi:hypothetical protein